MMELAQLTKSATPNQNYHVSQRVPRSNRFLQLIDLMAAGRILDVTSFPFELQGVSDAADKPVEIAQDYSLENPGEITYFLMNGFASSTMRLNDEVVSEDLIELEDGAKIQFEQGGFVRIFLVKCCRRDPAVCRYRECLKNEFGSEEEAADVVLPELRKAFMSLLRQRTFSLRQILMDSKDLNPEEEKIVYLPRKRQKLIDSGKLSVPYVFEKQKVNLEAAAGLVYDDHANYMQSVEHRNEDQIEDGQGPTDEVSGVGRTDRLWNSQERESLRRALLIFGAPNRWDEIRKVTDGILTKASDCELKSYSVSFVKQLQEALKRESKKAETPEIVDLQKYCQNLICSLSDSDILPIESFPYMWGGSEIIQTRSVQWTKRLEILTIIQELVHQFDEKIKAQLLAEEQNPVSLKMHASHDNMLSFIPIDHVQGQKPSAWWNPRYHDADLFIGTYKYGYGSYQQMKDDPNLSFFLVDIGQQYAAVPAQWPHAEFLTRRIKRLMQFIHPHFKDNKGRFNFYESTPENYKSTHLKLEMKKAVLNCLMDFGLIYMEGSGLVIDQKGGQHTPERLDMNRYKFLLSSNFNIPKHSIEDRRVERFIWNVVVEAQRIYRDYYNLFQRLPRNKDDEVNDSESDKKEKDERDPIRDEFRMFKTREMRIDEVLDQAKKLGRPSVLYEYDPDNDNLGLGMEMAVKIHKRFNLFQMIRQVILANDMKLFEEKFDAIDEQLKIDLDQGTTSMPQDWSVSLDRTLLFATNERGVSYLKQLKYDDEYGMSGMSVTKKKFLRRIEWLCSYFREATRGQITPPSFSINPVTGATDPSSSQTPVSIHQMNQAPPPRRILPKSRVPLQTDDMGNVQYPIEITQTLKVLNLGIVDFRRHAFHTSQSIYPIGFKSMRDHQSALYLNKRAYYTCEIMEKDDKPLFVVTSEEFPNQPIMKESPSGAWMWFAQKCNDLTKAKKGKVTISGPERFGLSDAQVIQLIQQLPNADKCTKYNWK